MDAKPHRPVRALRVRGDENAPIDAVKPGKTLHQRYKSTGALPSVPPNAGPKLAAKRTAFGDVSNTARNLQPSKDDSELPVKPVVGVLEKNVVAQVEKKPTALLRPAQRPLSVSSAKTTLSNASTFPQNGASVANQISAASQAAPQPMVVTRKTTTKRNTTIFKDPAFQQLDQVVAPQKENLVSAPTAPVHQKLAPRHHKSQPYLRAEQPVLRKTQSKHLSPTIEDKENDLNAIPVFSDDATAAKSSRASRHAVDDRLGQTSDAKPKVDSVKSEDLVPDELSQSEHNHVIMYQMIEERDGRLEQEAKAKIDYANELLSVAELTEPEEYWEDELEEEIYDDEGYTTARSYYSRGDNTTGGATTVMLPRVNAKVRRELAQAKEHVEASRTVEEIEEESVDATMVAEYGDEIFQYMKDLEMKMLPNAHYMDNQAEIQWSMRSVLMEWIMQVHHRFNLLPETLFLCANYIDRFLSCKIVSLGKLQLVGATAIFIAAKYEEINCPSVHEIAYMVDGGYTVDEILKAERFMLSMLQFELGWPGPMSFLRRISKADDYDVEIRTLAKYFLEVAMMDERFVGCPASFVAAGAHCLARLMLKKGDWTPAHVYYADYTYSQLRQLLSLIYECCENPQQHHAFVYEKYSDRRYQRASLFAEGQMQKGFKLLQSPTFSSVSSAAALYDSNAAWKYDGRS